MILGLIPKVLSSMTSKILSGFRDLIKEYDAAIVDLWGVIHDGYNLYPGAGACISEMRNSGISVLFLSNAPRRCSAVINQLTSLGLNKEMYDGVVTSGDATRTAIVSAIDDWHAKLGKKFYRLGPERDWGLMEDLDEWCVVEKLSDAEFILATGLFDDRTETLSDYASFFAEAVDYNLPMICANPDHVVIRNGSRVLCAGALAAAYERAGGEVVYHGKPFFSVYAMCFERLGNIPLRRIVAIGDSLHTDIAGANAAALDTLLIAGGIHAEELGVTRGFGIDKNSLESHLSKGSVRPTFAMPNLVW